MFHEGLVSNDWGPMQGGKLDRQLYNNRYTIEMSEYASICHDFLPWYYFPPYFSPKGA